MIRIISPHFQAATDEEAISYAVHGSRDADSDVIEAGLQVNGYHGY